MADTTTPVPGGSRTFTGLHSPAVSDGTVAFYGGDGVRRGIYYREVEAGGPLTKLIEVGDQLDGRIVSDLTFSQFGSDGDSIGFHARFADGTQGVYVGQFTPVPEPAALGLAAAGLGAVVWVHRRTHRGGSARKDRHQRPPWRAR